MSKVFNFLGFITLAPFLAFYNYDYTANYYLITSFAFFICAYFSYYQHILKICLRNRVIVSCFISIIVPCLFFPSFSQFLTIFKILLLTFLFLPVIGSRVNILLLFASVIFALFISFGNALMMIHLIPIRSNILAIFSVFALALACECFTFRRLLGFIGFNSNRPFFANKRNIFYVLSILICLIFGWRGGLIALFLSIPFMSLLIAISVFLLSVYLISSMVGIGFDLVFVFWFLLILSIS